MAPTSFNFLTAPTKSAYFGQSIVKAYINKDKGELNNVPQVYTIFSF